MANSKISELAAATTLAGTETLPVVQSGSTKKATISQVVAAIPSGIYAPLVAGKVPVGYLASGTPTGSKFVRDDGTLAVPPGGGSGTVASVSAASGRIVVAGTPTDPTIDVGTGIPQSAITGLGGAATLNVGTTAGTVAAGNDSRFTDSRTPTAHAASHAPAGSDDLTTALSATSAPVALGTAAVGSGTGFARQGHVHPTTGLVLTSDSRLTDARTPTAHAATHASGGSDAITTKADLVTGLVPTAQLGSGSSIAAKFLRGDQTWAVPSASVAFPLSQPYTDGAGTTVFWTAQSSQAARAPWELAVQDYANPGVASPNAYNTVVRLGYNATGSVTTEPRLYDTTEANYWPDGSTRWLERYVESIAAGGSPTSFRPWMFVVNAATNTVTSFVLRSNGGFNFRRCLTEDQYASFDDGTHVVSGTSTVASVVFAIDGIVSPVFQFRQAGVTIANFEGVNSTIFKMKVGGRLVAQFDSQPTYQLLGVGAQATIGVVTADASGMSTTVFGFHSNQPVAAAGRHIYCTNNGTSVWEVSGPGLPKWSAAGNTQTTVGAAGGASAPPATPKRWLKVLDSDGTALVLPAYLAA